MEKETIGMYLSGHPMEEYEEKVNKITRYNIGIINSAVEKNEEGEYKAVSGIIADGQEIKICGIIGSRKNKTTKNNSQMAFITLEDMYGSIEVIVFPRILSEFSAILQEEAAVVIEGKVSLREDEEPKIICQNVSLLNSYEVTKPVVHEDVSSGGSADTKGKKLFIRIESYNTQKLEALVRIASMSKGGIPIVISVSYTHLDVYKRQEHNKSTPKKIYTVFIHIVLSS